MKHYWMRVLALVLAAIPLAGQLAYVAGAWRSSPMDRPDRYLVPVVLALLVLAFARRRTSLPVRWSPLGLLLVAPGGIAFAWACLLDLHALQILSAEVVLCGAVWTAFGLAAALLAAPAFLVLVLMTTSTTYWLCSFAGVAPAVIVVFKGLVAAGAAVLVVRMRRWQPRAVAADGPAGVRRMLLWSVVPVLLVAAAVALAPRVGKLLQTAAPYCPDLMSAREAGWLIHEQQSDDVFRRFFGTSDARQYALATPSNLVHALVVDIGENIHEIHPATHCLRSSGWRIVKEAPHEVDLPGMRFVVSEAKAVIGGQSVISWTWYSNARLSTGSFFCFRRHAHEGGWRTWQLQAPAEAGDGRARDVLKGLLSSLAY